MAAEDAVAVEAVAPALGEPMDLMTALQLVLKKSLAHDGLIRGLHGAAKAIEKHAAQVCILAESCDSPEYVKLVNALCKDHNVPVIKVPSAKTLGEWAGLCKIDSEGFISIVRKQWVQKPQIASVGSCCLVGVISNGMLYVANAGDSRAVLGRYDKDASEVRAVQMSAEHNASIDSVRKELHLLHPDDPRIVVLKNTVWRVKGLIQISRSIGDAYLKDVEFNREPLLSKFRLPEPFHKPILSPDPSVIKHKLCHEDQFLIFASDGLWEQLSNQEAVDIVRNSPRNGIAKRLLKSALKEAAKKREIRYSDLEKISRGVRRHFHDDITVIVLFLDSTLISNSLLQGPVLSLKRVGGPVQAHT